MNVAAGRVANRFDLGGELHGRRGLRLVAGRINLGVRDLEAGTSDMVVVGGIDAIQNPFGFLCFSKTQALCRRAGAVPSTVRPTGSRSARGWPSSS